ncbi:MULTISPECIES: DUF4352 domain-containing protein [unclassified Mycobacterium]|uniref:DUF4352 domain-containing protein n=1 Tax=unclassified Mycobacterium TaxID=2642494 RepID=UPI0029C650A9|nr:MULTISPECIES: DUF4352 domain-containing protein [unclassified Mycobacterium]
MAAAQGSVATARSRYRGGLIAGALVLMAAVAAVTVALIGVAEREDGLGAAHLGEVRSGNFAYVVHRVEVTDVLADPEFPERNVTAEGRFVVVKMKVTNVTGARQTFHSSFNTVSDGSTEYRVDEATWPYVGEAAKDVDPGSSTDVAIVFDVPKGADLQSLVLRDGPQSEGVSVPL